MMPWNAAFVGVISYSMLPSVILVKNVSQKHLWIEQHLVTWSFSMCTSTKRSFHSLHLQGRIYIFVFNFIHVLFFTQHFLCNISQNLHKICGQKPCKLFVKTDPLCEKMRFMCFLLNDIFFSLEERQYCLGRIILDIHKCAFSSHILVS